MGVEKTFFKKTFYFMALPLGLFLTAFVLVGRSNKKAFDELRVAPDVTTVYVGDSHVELCIDARLIPNSYSMGKNAECYYYSYFKIKSLLENNPSVDTIYLGFSYHNLSDYYDDYVFGKFSPYLSGRYFFIMPNSERLKFLRHNSDNLSLFLRTTLRSGMENEFKGGYQPGFDHVAADPKTIDDRIDFQFYKNGKLRPFTELNMACLDKIIALCKAQKVELILMNTPLAKDYLNKVPLEYRNRYEELVGKYGLPVEDFSAVAWTDSCFIPDGDHVSVMGAGMASKYLASKK